MNIGAGRMRLTRRPVERVDLAVGDLAVGDRVKFVAEKGPYRVRAVSVDGRFAVCTKPYNPKRTVLYTVIDFDSGVRGPDDRVFGMGYETDEQCAEALAEFESGDLEVSVRRDYVIDIEHVDRSRRTRAATAPEVGKAAGPVGVGGDDEPEEER